MIQSTHDHLDKSVYSWLALKLGAQSYNKGNQSPCQEDIELLKTLLTNETATAFFLVWPIMERELFGKNFIASNDPRSLCKSNHIKTFSFCNSHLYSKLKPHGQDRTSFDYVAEKFHSRYQDDKIYKKLLNCKVGRTAKIGDEKNDFDLILDESFSKLTDQQKMYLLLFVTYRYRNNIFHGNKHISEWIDFSDQIENCVEFMMTLIDAYNQHKHSNS